MSALVVFMRQSITDQGELDQYSAKVRPTFVGHEVKAHAAYGELEVLEGPPILGAVVLEFPDMDAARAWYNSPAYQEVVQHRFKGADYRAFIVNGIQP